jgi:SNF2 family DNA or RNA helicase
MSGILLCVAGGAAGLTLTEADTVILMEPSLSPTLEAQAKGRVHRLGEHPIPLSTSFVL